MSDEETVEKAVEITLPDDPITEVELSDKKADIKEEKPQIKTREEVPVSEKKPQVDEREKALNDLKKQYEHQKRVAEAERNARQQAEHYARQQAQHVGRAQNEVQDSNYRIIMNAIDATEQAAANAERDYAEDRKSTRLNSSH